MASSHKLSHCTGFLVAPVKWFISDAAIDEKWGTNLLYHLTSPKDDLTCFLVLGQRLVSDGVYFVYLWFDLSSPQSIPQVSSLWFGPLTLLLLQGQRGLMDFAQNMVEVNKMFFPSVALDYLII